MNTAHALLNELTEKEWTTQVVDLATMTGWRRYHTLRSKGSASGWPDEALARDRLILAELKREGGKPTPAQAGWLDVLALAGAEVYLWTPLDLDEVAQILGRRWRFEPASRTLVAGGVSFAPRSTWIAGSGRRG